VELHLVEPEFEADLVYRAMRPDMARVDVVIGGEHVFTEAVSEYVPRLQDGRRHPAALPLPESGPRERRATAGDGDQERRAESGDRPRDLRLPDASDPSFVMRQGAIHEDPRAPEF
jgi:hypothetical protein